MELDCVIKDQLRDDAQTDIYLQQCSSKYYKIVNTSTGKFAIGTANMDPNMAENTISVVKEMAEVLQAGPRHPLQLEEMDENSVKQNTLKHAWLRMSNQYTSRISMFLMRNAMLSRSLFVGQTIDYEKHIWKCRVHRLINENDQEVASGIMDAETRFCYLSQSAKMFILLQVSQELLKMSDEGLGAFFAALFQKWKEAETSHVVSIIAFARKDGEDYYRVIIDWEIQSDFSSSLDFILGSLKSFQEEMGSNMSFTRSGNIMEAVNMVLQIYNRHHLDRDLTKTGLSIVVVSASEGVFDVPKSLSALTKRRCCDIGVWLQFVLIGKRPSQVAPIFVHSDSEGSVPHWVDCDHFGTVLVEASGENIELVDEDCTDCGLKWDLYPPLKYDPEVCREFGWESLVTPPCLPLRSKSITPTDQDISEDLYMISSYEVYPNISSPFLVFGGAETEYEKLGMISEELMLLRLNQNYQIVKNTPGSIVVSHGHSFQTIKYSKKTSFITVKLYNWKKSSKSLSQDYIYFLQTSTVGGFQKRSIIFSTEEDYKWELMDNLLVGNDTGSEDFAGFWKSRFILIPGTLPSSISESIFGSKGEFSESDIRLAAFSRFMNFITSKFSKQETEESVMTRLGITATTAALSSHLNNLLHIETPPNENIQVEKSKSIDMIPLTKDSTLEEIVSMMQDPNIGLSIKRRTWFFSTYDKSFIGSEALDWIMKFYPDINSREEAIYIANLLIKEGVWEHVNQEHDFIDGHFYYRFTPKYEKGQKSLHQPARRSVVEVSREIRLNLDGFAERCEWVMMHYDTIHNPRIAFHFQIQWINCSSRLLDSMIHSWCNKARILGFSLIEVPVQPPKLFGPSPFEQAIPIYLAAQPPSVPFIAHHRDTLLIEEFLVHHQFVLDLEPDTHFPSNPCERYFKRSTPRPAIDHLQYVSRSGSALVQIVRDQNTKHFSFIWSRNKLALVNPVQTKEKVLALDEFQALCSNKEELEQFWQNLVHSLTINPSSLMSVL